MKLENNRKHFFRWDAGCFLILEEPADRVDFSVTDSEKVYCVAPEAGRVRVPDECLQLDGALEVYAVAVDAEGQQTRTYHTFPILPRRKPDDYVYTPGEYSSYYRLSEEVKTKLTCPAGGEPGQILTKTSDGVAWTHSGGGGAGTTFFPHISEDGILTWDNELGLPNPEPVDLRGGVGEDGFSPTIAVEAVAEGLLLTITNRDGVNEVILPKGIAGGEGQSGATFTPHLSDDGVLSWTNDKGLTNPAPICLRGSDGAPGQPGPQGVPGETGPVGQTGAPGADGYSPQKGVDYFTAEDIARIRSGLLSVSGGTLSGALDMGGNSLKSIAFPIDSTDGASKEYVDRMRLIFQNVSVPASAFVSDATYGDYPFKANIALKGALASMIPEVVFPMVDYGYAPICASYNGGVSVYTDSAPEDTTVFPTIILWRGDSV